VTKRQATCFFEEDASLALGRRSGVEFVGTLLLMFAVTGAGLTAKLWSNGNGAIGLAVSAIATSGALVGLILAFGKISGGHFNPLITALQWLGRERTTSCTIAYVCAQLTGAIAGAMIARLVFGAGGARPAPATADWRLVLSEVVSSAALMLVVFGCIRSKLVLTGPFAVGAWLTAAIFATPSASYANPAVAVAAIFADGPVTLPLGSALAYSAAEVGGALVAFAVISLAYPKQTS
jgi:glycerol uptake facilitator-like aquaporin